MDLAKTFSNVLPPLMHDPVMYAVPFFVLFLIIEWTAARKLAHIEALVSADQAESLTAAGS